MPAVRRSLRGRWRRSRMPRAVFESRLVAISLLLRFLDLPSRTIRIASWPVDLLDSCESSSGRGRRPRAEVLDERVHEIRDRVLLRHHRRPDAQLLGGLGGHRTSCAGPSAVALSGWLPLPPGADRTP